MENTNPIKVLIINASKIPNDTKKYEFLSSEGDKIKDTVLSELNRLGRFTYALIKYKSEYFVVEHTAEGNNKSDHYEKRKVTYHPFMNELV